MSKAPSLLLLLLILSPLFVFCYNVDIGYPFVYADPEPGGSNYFGYSVALSSGSRLQPGSLLVGAPRTSNGVGRVYRCVGNVTKNQGESPCRVILIDEASSPRSLSISPKPGERYDVTTGNSGGLGVSIAAGDSSNFAVCAPHSMVYTPTPKFPNFYNNRDMRGYCYDYKINDTLRRDNEILKATDKFPFTPYLNSLYGFSISYATNKGSDAVRRIVGQPGVNKVEIKDGNKKIVKLMAMNNLANLGYSVSSGYFFHRNELLFVAGAPAWLAKGKVMIYYQDGSKEMSIEGSVLGEYFGSSLAVGDFDGDGLDDLAVGAPHWGEVDFGRVYTFYSSRDVSQQNFRAGIRLQGATGNGEFGYTLAAADLDSDGYSDLIVAAPWEKSGVVYIFYGHVDFRREDSAARITQRIEPSDFGIRLQVQRFGFSLSNSVDIDDNGYPDLAIGAYKSGQAFVLRSKPVIETEVKLISEPSALTKSTVSFVAKVCVKYHGKKAPDTQELWFEMTADKHYKRVKNGSWNIFADRFPRDQSYCTNQTIFLKNPISNFFNPIVISVKHSIREKGGHEFCPSCPVLSRNPLTAGIKSLSVPFVTGCKGDVQCKASLFVSASFSGTGTDNEWVVASGDVGLNLIVTNDGEPAYGTELVVDIPAGIRLRSAVTSCREGSKENAVSLVCAIADPLGTGEQKALSVSLDMEQMVEAADGTVLTFNITRRTSSADYGVEKSTTSLSLTVRHTSYLTIKGTTERESIAYGRMENETEVPIRHFYQVVKVGSMRIVEARLTISVPISIPGRNDNFLNLTVSEPVDSSGNSYSCHKYVENDYDNGQSYSLQGADWPEIKGARDSTKKSTSREKWNQPIDGIVYLNCSTPGVLCDEYICAISLLKTSDDVVNFDLDMVLDTGAFHASKWDSLNIKFNTNVTVKIIEPEESGSTLIRNSSAPVTTTLYNIPEPQKLAGWIIPTSIVFGILLLCALAVILFKVGFFKRQKKADMATAKGTLLIVKGDENCDERYG